MRTEKCDLCGTPLPKHKKRWCSDTCNWRNAKGLTHLTDPNNVRKMTDWGDIPNKDDFTYVYYLPEEHYIGVSINMKDRMKSHNRKGKIVEGMEIVSKFEREVDAYWLEICFHQRGYNGFNTNKNNGIRK